MELVPIDIKNCVKIIIINNFLAFFWCYFSNFHFSAFFYTLQNCGKYGYSGRKGFTWRRGFSMECSVGILCRSGIFAENGQSRNTRENFLAVGIDIIDIQFTYCIIYSVLYMEGLGRVRNGFEEKLCTLAFDLS